MKGFGRFLVLLLAALLVAQPMLAVAGSPVRIIPTGNVSVLDNGKEVNRFKSEMPLPEGTLMVCNGNCLVQSRNLQLVAQDQAVFALAEAKDRWDLTVKDGRIDFAMGADAKSVAFHTPQDLVRTERVIVPASGNGLVRGYVQVSDQGTQLSVQEGTLQVSGNKGVQTIEAGKSITLAQATMGPAVERDTGSKGKTEIKGTAGYYVPGLGCVSGATAATLAVIGAGAGAGIGYGIYTLVEDDDDHHDVSPGGP